LQRIQIITISRLLLTTVLLTTVLLTIPASGQDPIQSLNQSLRDGTKDMFGFTFEERTRWEEKDGVNFGKSVNQQDMLSRLRIGADFTPVSWFSISAMGQDARAPFYGANAPNTIRDTMDLQEAYIRLRAKNKKGLGGEFGREMLNFGESRLIGSPQWSNVSRTFDTGRVYYQSEKNRLEVSMVSPVKVRSDAFNAPDLGERIWGMYDTFSSFWRGASFDAYALRHSENKIGGWTGAGTLGTDTFGGRFYGPLPGNFAYGFEGIGQTGHVGLLDQRAHAGFAGVTHNTSLFGRSLDLSVEYKLASGTGHGATNSSTFDQLSPANHDKFGQEDLFGWRNLRTLKSLETLGIAKGFALNAMYSDDWLDSAFDSLYNSAGSVIATSKTGSAGTRVGQELDGFVTYKLGAHLFGAGFGHFFKDEFIDETTKNINPRYLYVFQQYSFK
jgi:alginate export protein